MTRSTTRRAFLRTAFGHLAAASAAGRFAWSAPAAIPVTGRPRPALAGFDRMLTAYMHKEMVLGAALAIGYEGRLLYARGFGFADPATHALVRPMSLFRIASTSKPFTAAAVMQLFDHGKLRLGDHVAEILDVQLDGVPVVPKDERLKRVTVLQVLQHRGGWDRDKSFDPMFRPLRIAREFHAQPPATAALIIASMWKRPLDFNPGARYAYSNFGYCVLGRVIEKVSGQPYGAYVRQHVLAPLGIHRMRLGRSLESDRAPDEVKYVSGADATGQAVMGPNRGKMVPLPYGTFCIEAMDAHGSWIASAPDLVRFAGAFGNPPTHSILSPRALRVMFAPPQGLAGHTRKGAIKSDYYGCGWEVVTIDRAAGTFNIYHDGYLDGSLAMLVRRHDSVTWGLVFNNEREEEDKNFVDDLDGPMHDQADAIERWPAHDEFPALGYT